MFRIFSLSVVFVFALFTSAVQAQVQFIDVDPSGSVYLNGNFYDPVTNELRVAGWNPGTDESFLYRVNMGTGTWTQTQIPSAINGGRVTAVGISRDGLNVFGWMDSPGSDPFGAGEGFFAPISDPSDRTLIGFLPGYMNESRVRDMSATGLVVGNSAGTTAGITWTQSQGMQMLPMPGSGAGTGANAVNAAGTQITGLLSMAGGGTEGAGRWMLNQGLWQAGELPPGGDTGNAIACSNNGLYVGGDSNFNAAAWIDGTFNQILLDGTPLNGEVRAVTDDGFFVGVGLFGEDTRGFVWHEGWAEAMTARDYVLWSQGIDIGHDIRELNGAFSYGGNLYLTGYGSGAILQTPAFVPEPGALALLGVGSLLGFRRRRAI